MKLFLIIFALSSFSASAETVNAYSCQAHCLKIDWNKKTILSHGLVEALGHEMPEAFKNLSTLCSKWVTRQLGYGRPYLVDGDFSPFPHRSENPWRGVVYSWKFYSAYPTSTDSWEININRNTSIEFSRAKADQNCVEVNVDPREIIQY